MSMRSPSAIRAARGLGFATSLVDVGEVRLHCVRHGQGPPLLLLHGWPEFWLVWQKVMRLLGPDHALIAPDLRGFGASRQPTAGPSDQAGPGGPCPRPPALLDRLGIERVGLVAHDVGSLGGAGPRPPSAGAHRRPFFFDCFYPGIGRRWL